MKKHLPKEIVFANMRMTKKLLVLCAASYLLAAVLVLLDSAGAAQELATFFRGFIPSLSHAPKNVQPAFISLFGLTISLAPAAVGYFIAGDPLRTRLRLAICDGRRLNWRRAFFLYFVGIPIIGLTILIIVGTNSLESVGTGTSRGARYVGSMAYSPAVLLLLAPPASTGLWLLGYFFLFPFIGLISPVEEK